MIIYLKEIDGKLFLNSSYSDSSVVCTKYDYLVEITTEKVKYLKKSKISSYDEKLDTNSEEGKQVIEKVLLFFNKGIELIQNSLI